MKCILIVDDEQPFLLSLQEGLSDQANYQIMTALNGQEALDILHNHKIDLLVTDIKMPVMDGFGLLAHMSKDHPEIPVIVMTAFGTQEIEERLKKIDNFNCLEKPLDLDILADTIDQALDRGERSFIRGIDLATFLQLVHLEKKTCTLKIKSKSEIGYLYIDKGELIAAETGSTTGEEAAHKIVCWQASAIEMDSVCDKPSSENITTSIERLLLEAFKIEDERKESERASDQPSSNVSINAAQLVMNTDVDRFLEESSGIFNLQKKEGGPEEKTSDHGRAQAERLSEFLNQSASVVDFGIYASDDLMFAKTSKQTAMAQHCPSVYFTSSCKLAESLGQSDLKYLTIRRSQGPRMLLFSVGELQAIVALRPGIGSGTFLEQITELNHSGAEYES